jgi:hypothetical protein
VLVSRRTGDQETADEHVARWLMVDVSFGPLAVSTCSPALLAGRRAKEPVGPTRSVLASGPRVTPCTGFLSPEADRWRRVCVFGPQPSLTVENGERYANKANEEECNRKTFLTQDLQE